MSTKGIYIYGFVPNFYSTDMFRSFENSGIYVIPFQNISAIVSDRENEVLDFSDRELLGNLLIHHQKTIEDLMAKGFNMLIPMRLATILNTKEEVINILAKGYNLIIETLKKIEFLIEIDIAVTWADISGIILETAMHPEIIELKQEILEKSNNLSQIDQVKIGMLIQEKLDKKNKEIELNILDSLAQISIDIKTHEVMNDQMITNSAFLINRNNLENFEHAIDKLDENYKGLLNFKLIGPLPCYSFYTIEFKVLNPENIEQGGKELGLNKETTESEIKRAYLEKAKLFHPDSNMENNSEENFNKINKAYHTLLDYSFASKQSNKEELIFLTKERVIENLILVKIKD
jgi:hypothetical protein